MVILMQLNFNTIFFFFMSFTLYSQNIDLNTTNPHPTAMLDVVSNNKGFLPPRMSAAARDSIVSPARGLIIYCTTSECLNFFNGTNWMELCGSTAPSAFVCGQTFIDQRDGTIYPSVNIGGKCWMAKGLKYNATGSIAGTGNYHPDSVGRYYLWSTALQGSPPMNGNPGTVRGVCPNGWHLPTRIELDALTTAILGDGNALKRVGQGIPPDGEGTNTTGFSLILAGRYNGSTSSFQQQSQASYIWSSSDGTTTARAYYQALSYDVPDIYVIQSPFANMYYNVRCIKD